MVIFDDIHGAFNHTPGAISGSVVLFNDDSHDSAGWVGNKPYFSVAVNCSTCHISNLTAIHGNFCATCHPQPYDSLGGNWGGTCQQGGCHTVYHEDTIKAHLPWANTANPANDCLKCHISFQDMNVTQAQCLNCHASYTSDVTPPVTTSDAQAVYEGGAKIVFSISDNGKVGIGTTFYKLDSGTVNAGSGVTLNSPGPHTLEFWSVDQSGNIESPTKTASFQILSDTTPPTTTSNAIEGGTYYQGALITLTATDNSATGVKTTYYKLNNGPTQIGKYVQIPATAGTISYTLDFWSEDYAYNVEVENTVSFTVISGGGTLRLVWGDSDAANPAYPPAAGDSASWTIRTGSPTGPVFRTGSATYYWNGISTIDLPINNQAYYGRVNWIWQYGEESGSVNFGPFNVTTPGQTFRVQY